MRNRGIIKRTFFLGLGITVILIGIIGLFLPILQGILLIILGLWLLAEYAEVGFVRKWHEWMHKKYKRHKNKR